MKRGRIQATAQPMGAALLLAGALVLVAGTPAPARAATHRVHHANTAVACSPQHNLNDPTTSQNQVLDSYSFTIQRGSSSFSTCTLFQNTQPGDAVTVEFVAHAGANPSVSLVSYEAPPSSPNNQTLFGCATFNVSNAPAVCTASASPALTVHVPGCGFQIDFIYGTPLQTLVAGTYANNKVWINGTAGDRKTGVCTTPTPTATPSPTSGELGIVSSGQGAATPTPVTGAEDPGAQPLIGLALMILGATSVAWGRRRRSVSA